MNNKQFKRDKIRLYAFLTVVFFIFIFLSNLIFFSDDSNFTDYDFISIFGLNEDSVLTREAYVESDVYNSLYSQRFISDTATAVTNYKNALNNYPNKFKVSMDSSLFCDNVLCIVTTDTANDFIFQTYPEGSYLLFGTNGDYCVMCPTGYDYAVINGYKTTGGCAVNQNNLSGQLVYSYLNTTTMGGQNVVRTDVYTNSGAMFFISSLPIKYYNGRLNGNTNLNNVSDESLNFNPVSGGSDVNVPTSENNLYFDNADVTYDIGDLNGGNVSIWGTPNPYILNHPDEFVLHYRYLFSIDVAYNVVGGSSVKNNAVGTQQYNVGLSDFINHGYAEVKSLADIERAATFTNDGQNVSIRSVVEYYYEQGPDDNDRPGTDWDPSKVQWYDFTLTTYYWLEDISGNTSAWYSETYNFLDGTSTVNSNGITKNNNPFSSGSYNNNLSEDDVLGNGYGVSNDNIPSSNNGSGGNSASAVTGDNNIVINNNPTFNNDVSGGSGSGSSGGASESAINFYNTFNPFVLIFNKLNNGNSTISDETSDTIGSNRFITLMSSVFSFIPITMWETLSWYLVASLGILIVAVVLRVILDLL